MTKTPKESIERFGRLKGMALIAAGALGLTFVPHTATAQDQVVLRAADGLEIAGTAVTLDDGIYTITTALGQLLLDAENVECIGEGCPNPDEAATAERPVVTLTALDGATSISGRLITLEDGAYVLATALGELRLAVEDVICQGAGCPDLSDDPGFSVVAEGSAFDALLPVLLEGYAQSRGATVTYTVSGDASTQQATVVTADGSVIAEVDIREADAAAIITGLADNTFDLGFTKRRMNAIENAQLEAAGFQTVLNSQNEALLALDAVTVALHPSNQVRTLSPAELARIWSGEVTNWQQLGGRNIPINIHTYSDGGALETQVFLNEILQTPLTSIAQVVDRHDTGSDLVEAVINDRGGIGVASRAVGAAGGARLISLERSCGLLASPSTFGMKIGDYPAVREIFTYANPQAITASARSFLEYTQTEAAQDLIGDAGFGNALLERTGLEDMGMMLVHNAAVEPDFDGNQFARLMREMRGADRLSIAFRFRPGSSILDAESVSNLGDLADRIEAGEFAGQEILLVGFADSVGPSDSNTVLAGQRANSVLNILTRELPSSVLAAQSITPLSFGEQLPMACNDVESGRDRNRRVEVWTRFVSDAG